MGFIGLNIEFKKVETGVYINLEQLGDTVKINSYLIFLVKHHVLSDLAKMHLSIVIFVLWKHSSEIMSNSVVSTGVYVHTEIS